MFLTRDFVVVYLVFGEGQIVSRGQDFEAAVWLRGVAQRVYLTPTIGVVFRPPWEMSLPIIVVRHQYWNTLP